MCFIASKLSCDTLLITKPEHKTHNTILHNITQNQQQTHKHLSIKQITQSRLHCQSTMKTLVASDTDLNLAAQMRSWKRRKWVEVQVAAAQMRSDLLWLKLCECWWWLGWWWVSHSGGG